MLRMPCGSAIALLVFGTSVSAADAPFNDAMMRAYRKLSNPAEHRRELGYSKASYFTRDLDYGQEPGAIKAKGAPFTMCNAAVVETFVEAINIYAQSQPAWKPQTIIPTTAWNASGFTGIRAHLFSESLLEYPPLENIKREEIPASLVADIQKFQAEESMASALVHLGIGSQIPFASAKSGDIISFDRTNDRIDGTNSYGGHSVVFLGFLKRDQSLTETYDPASVVGFKYFSSQGSKTAGGLSERWAYFKGFCPLRSGYTLPADPKQAGCADRIDSPAHRASTPFEKAGQPTDCCVNKSGAYGPRVGRIHSPAEWTFSTKYPALKQSYAALKDRIEEFVRNRQRAAVRVSLLAKGAVAMEDKKSAPAARYIEKVRTDFRIDLRQLAQPDQSVDLSPALANRITRATPRFIVLAANRRVTTSTVEDIKEEIARSATTAMNEMASVETRPNPRLDQSAY